MRCRDFSPSLLLAALLLTAIVCPTSPLRAQDSPKAHHTEIHRLNEEISAQIKEYKYDEARPRAEQAVELARKADEPVLLAAALLNLGNLSRRMEDYSMALPTATEAAEIFTELGEFSQAGESWNVVGGAYWKMTDYSKALEFWEKARLAFEQAGDRSGEARILNNFGITYRGLGQYDEALELYRRALAIQEELNDERMIAMLLNNMGNLYLYQDKPQEALKPLLRALKIKERLGDPASLANTVNNLGEVYEQLGNQEAALEAFTRSLELGKDLGLRKENSSTRRHIAGIYRAQGRYADSLRELRTSLRLAEEVNAGEEIREAHKEIAETYSTMGLYKEALEAFQEYERIARKIFDENNAATIAEMRTRFEVDRRNRDIETLRRQKALDEELLQRQVVTRRFLFAAVALLCVVLLLIVSRYRLKVRANRLIEEKNQALREATDQLIRSEKDAAMGQLVAGVMHEINNPINFVSAGLPTLRRDVENLSLMISPEHRQAAEKKKSQIDKLLRAIEEGSLRAGAIIKDLRTFTQAEQAVVGKVDLEEVLDSVLALYREEMGERIRVVRRGDDVPGLTANQGGIHQVLRNLIGNAVEAIDGEGTITCTTTVEEESISLAIQDTGRGIPDALQSKIFDPFVTTQGVGLGTGLGLATSRAIIEGHGGTIELNTSSTDGTEFVVRLPRRREAPSSDATSLDTKP